MRRYNRFGQLIQRRVFTPEEKAANAEKKAADKVSRMTCQICGRRILANTGSIALHGYQRPEYGWQTASCSGARELPLEVSCDLIPPRIDSFKRIISGKEAVRDNYANGRLPIPVKHYLGNGRYEDRTVEYPVGAPESVDNWDNISDEEKRLYFAAREYEEKKKTFVWRLNREIDSYKGELKRLETVVENWKQTHGWNTELGKFAPL